MTQDAQDGLQRRLGPFSATNLVIANMVGTGIFTTSGFIMGRLQDPTALLSCWLLGGLLALCGALCYAELGANLPRAGGEYAFLRQSFGPAMAFLSGWVSLTVGFSAPIAAASIAFATYLWPIIAPGQVGQIVWELGGVTIITLSLREGIAIGVIVLLTLAHYLGLTFGSRVQNALTMLKLAILAVFICAGFWVGQGGWSNFHPPASSQFLWQGDLAVSLIFVAFAYSGWNAAAYLGAEIKNPSRNIPRALILGTLVVCGVYLLMNLLYLYALTPGEMSGVVEVAGAAANALFGQRVGLWLSLAITLCLLSLISAMIMTGPRVYYAMAQDGLFFRPIARLSGGRHTPGAAIFLQAGLAALLVVTASFEKLLIYIGFTLSIIALLTVAGLMRLRRRSGFSAEYRTPLYPLTPLVFILANLWIVVYCLGTNPQASIWGLATIGLGLLVYWYFKRRKGVGP